MACDNIAPLYGTGFTYEPRCLPLDGATTTITFSFPFLDSSVFVGPTPSDYIFVYLRHNTTGTYTQLSHSSGFTMPNATSVTLSQTYSSDYTAIIYRDSSVNGLEVRFAEGDARNASNLQRNADQCWYILEEATANVSLLQDIAEDKSNFASIFTFDGVTYEGETVFYLSQGLANVTQEVAEASLFITLNGASVQAGDYTTGIGSSGGSFAYVVLDQALTATDTLEIRVAQIQGLAVSLEDDSITNNHLQDGSVTIEKLDLDGDGSNMQVAGWLGMGSAVFGPYTLDSDWISDFRSAVEESPLSAFADPTANISMNNKNITNLKAATAAHHAVRYDQLTAISSSSVQLTDDEVVVAKGATEIVDFGYEVSLLSVSVTYSTGLVSVFYDSIITFPYDENFASTGIQITKSGNTLSFYHNSIASTATIHYVAIGK